VSNLVIAAQQFEPGGRVLDVQAYGEGNVNDTYLVTLDGATEAHFVLQRINTHVFRRPELIMANLRVFAEHVRQRLARENGSDRRWVLPYVLPAKDGKDYYVDPEGGFWRALNYVPRSVCYQTIQDSNAAKASTPTGASSQAVLDFGDRAARGVSMAEIRFSYSSFRSKIWL